MSGSSCLYFTFINYTDILAAVKYNMVIHDTHMYRYISWYYMYTYLLIQYVSWYTYMMHPHPHTHCMHTHIRMYRQMNTQTYTETGTHIDMHTHTVHTCIDRNSNIHRTDTHVYTHIITHTYKWSNYWMVYLKLFLSTVSLKHHLFFLFFREQWFPAWSALSFLW